MKKINFKFKFKYNIKIAIFTTSALFFLYLLYLSIPSLYDTGRVQKVLSDKLLANFEETQNDIIVNIRQFIIIGNK